MEAVVVMGFAFKFTEAVSGQRSCILLFHYPIRLTC